jgi:hypothetical protein
MGRIVPAGIRAHLRGRIEIVGTAASAHAVPGELVLNGVLIEGALVVRDGQLGVLRLEHCTLAPRALSFESGTNPQLRVTIARCITGDLAAASVPDLDVTDTIVDGAIDADALHIERSTITGTTRCRTIEASECIFVGVLTVQRRQAGCVRFSALPFASRTPRRYRCQPAGARDAVAPVFSSLRFGDPAFGMLAPGCPAAIARGAEDEGEMGAWNFLQAPMRLRNVVMALDEYLRFGLEAGVIVASQQP